MYKNTSFNTAMEGKPIFFPGMLVDFFFIFSDQEIFSFSPGIPVDDPIYFTFDHEWSLLNFLSYRQQCIDFRFNKQKEHERYVRSLTAGKKHLILQLSGQTRRLL